MWKTLKLEEIVDISIGKTPSRGNPKFWDKGKTTKNIWVSIADLTSSKGLFIDDSKEYISDEGAKLFKSVPSETLIMSFKLSIGKLAITKCKLRTNEAIAALRIKEENLVTNKYLFYFLSSINWVALAGRDIKVKGMTLNKAKLKEIPISFPPIEKQKIIVAKLDDTFAEIDNLVLSNSDQIKNAQLLNKLTLNSKIKDLPSSSYQKIGDVCSLVRGPFGGSLKKSIFVEKGFAIYEQAHPINNQCELFRYFINKDKFEEMRRFEVKPGDILMSCSGTLGKTTVVPSTAPRGIINQALLKITPSDLILSEYLQIIMESDFFQKLIWDISGGAAQTNVPAVKILKNIAIPIPTIREQEIFINWKETLDELKLAKLYQQKRNLFFNLKEAILLNAMRF
ncbi:MULTISPECIES: restriction endonuclease subunit S [unclassified Prochlorococcus]|uniref:restriction endonuclease subunit S n=1 Tax=unclassified Prochlorococcus TaxID=2627481 RepID=UPI00097CD482|nr:MULTISPECIES: restriction endonuclease subunit S [unclassified Prochlorococcus]AQL29942.1 hypothetical protein BSR22_01570 [Prochlorococcus sp. RS50]AQL33118.1 hypothetical protein BS620_09110 [Prochlorococcus sp. RS01]AQL34380.1 hypothetical protein BS621_06230 [Prochlorococcus sp. RS04]